MLAIIKSTCLTGLEGQIINVEVDVSAGLPSFDIVGLPDTAVRESKDRVKTAIKNAGFEFPMQRITVNLAPADIKKTGPIFDLPIAVGILVATRQSRLNNFSEAVFNGELSLDGSVRPIHGVLPMAANIHSIGYQNYFVPAPNSEEAALINRLKVFPITCLPQLVGLLAGELEVKPVSVNPFEYFRTTNDAAIDFSDIKGQAFAKRALEIAAAGGHNILMSGPPGSGKTLLARSLPGILPGLTLEEALSITKIHSLANLLVHNQPLVTQRPFRSPHHSASLSSLVGGGRVPKPGEVSLAHHGVLFLDELPEFYRDTLEALRQPLEDGQVTITRVQSAISYPARIQLVAALNPCPCGFYGDETRECNCSSGMIQRYKAKISGPLLDRIDIQIEVPRVPFDDLESKALPETSSLVRERVETARGIQRERLKQTGITCNAHMGPRETRIHAAMTKEAALFLKTAFNKLQLSARVADRIKKLSRTIADLANIELIQTEHVAEAIQLRNLDRNL